ncbi:hypothetical protein PV11_00958 [Exophiala sideris]|uniref:DUF6594 domain-containing protein n=1 Tax=Exophiala sideris TaxID=1016849 RepID=A0A0D1W8X1_9EURO|nr:hypothetical protein PV11_00958 [Exophiala sideris]
MAAVMAPIELPAGRRSYHNTSPIADIHDPNWIPVLDSTTFKPSLPLLDKEGSITTLGSFSLFPAQSKPQSALSHKYSKSSMAPESVSSDSRSQSPSHVEPLPSIGVSFLSNQSGTFGHRPGQASGSGSVEEKISVSADTPAGDILSRTNAAENSNTAQKPSLRPDQSDGYTIDSQTRPSTASSRKTSVLPPTSKYNRKPVPSMTAPAERPSFVPNLPQTPHESPRLPPTAPVAVPPILSAQTLASPKVRPIVPPPEPESVPRVQPAKSTASERRQRALHSHPSNLSLRTRRSSSSDDAELAPSKPPSIRQKPRKSTDSRTTTPRSTIYEGQMPTSPAPTTPLPELPPEARRPPTRDNASTKSTPALLDEPFLPPTSNLRPSEHAGMASFMTEKNTIVFRRFDDVHVRLLLCLQDEISQLEKELAKLESPTSSNGGSAEKMSQKMKVMRELRKVVSEYDTMFMTWNKMQANKITESTTRDLKQWLQKPGTGAQAGLGIEMRQDVQWLDENSKDLSSIEINEKDDMLPQRPQGSSSRAGIEAFLALFGCGGRRK